MGCLLLNNLMHAISVTTFSPIKKLGLSELVRGKQFETCRMVNRVLKDPRHSEYRKWFSTISKDGAMESFSDTTGWLTPH